MKTAISQRDWGAEVVKGLLLFVPENWSFFSGAHPKLAGRNDCEFWWRPFFGNHLIFPENPPQSDSRLMKIWVKFVCCCFHLSKKPASANSGYAPDPTGLFPSLGQVKLVWEDFPEAFFTRPNNLSWDFSIRKAVPCGRWTTAKVRLSPLFLFVYTNWIDKCSQADECATTENYKISRLLFADDLVLLFSTESGLQGALNRFEDVCDTTGMKISPAKTKVLHVSRNPDQCSFQWMERHWGK